MSPKLNITPDQVRYYRETEERRRAFTEELPLMDTPDGKTVDEEAYGHLVDDLLQHEGEPTTADISDPSQWAFEDNDLSWVNAPTHSHDELQEDGTELRVYDEHIEVDMGLFFDQDVERNRARYLSPSSLRAKAINAHRQDVIESLNEQWQRDASTAFSRALDEPAKEAGRVTRKVKYFAALKKRALAMGITEPANVKEFILRYTLLNHPEFIPGGQ